MADKVSLSELEAFDPHAPRGGRERRFCCPYCGKGKPRDANHRCLCLNTESGLWNCKRCKASGKLTDFWQERPKASGRDLARQQLRRAFDLPKTAPQPDAHDDEARAKAELLTAQLEAAQPLEGTAGAAYLLGRGVSVEVASAAGVQFSPDWRVSPKMKRGSAAVIFSIRNRAGDIVAAQGREIGGAGKFSLGRKAQGIFATAGAFDAKRFIIAEAPIDALSLAVSGFPAVALCGTTGPDWLPRLCAFRRVLLAFDADEPGDDAARALTPKLESFGATCQRLRPEKAKDWNEVLNVYGKGEIKRQIAALTWAEVQAQSALYWKSKGAKDNTK